MKLHRALAFYARLFCIVVVAAHAAQAVPTGPAVLVLDAFSNTRTAPAAPGAFVAISSPLYFGILKRHIDELSIQLEDSDGTVLEMSAIAAPEGSTAELFSVIPIGAALGWGHVSVRVGAFSETAEVKIVKSAPSIFTRGYRGSTPAIATHRDASQITLTSPATPGEEITLWATGMGGSSPSEVSVEVAGKSSAVLYAGAQGLTGLDQINLVIPKDVYGGCYVPVMIRVGEVVSNYASVPIATRTGDACVHPLGLRYADLKNLTEGGTVSLAYLRIGDPAARVNGMAAMWLARANEFAVADLSWLQMPDSLNFSCDSPVQNHWAFGDIENFDAGPMTITTPTSETLTLAPRNGPYTIGSLLTSISAGNWQLAAGGGTSLSAFTLTFSTSAAMFPLLAVERGSEDLTVRWRPEGFKPNDTVSVGPCRVRATDGQIVVPGGARQSSLELVLSPDSSARQLFSLQRPDGEPVTMVTDYAFSFSLDSAR